MCHGSENSFSNISDTTLPWNSLSNQENSHNIHSAEANFHSEKFSLETTISGCLKHNSVNVNNTNFTVANSNKENCNAKLPASAEREETKRIHQEITGEHQNAVAVLHSEASESGYSAADKKIKSKNSREQPPYVGKSGSGLQFLETPKGDDMRIHDLRLDEEYLLFEAFSDLMGYLQPWGSLSDLLRKIMNKRVSTLVVVFQVLKMETTTIIWITIWTILSICLPIGVVLHMCCPNKRQRLREDFSVASESVRGFRKEKLLEIMVYILLKLFLASLLLILASNEQISKSVSKMPWTVGIVYEDLNKFLRNTHNQITFSVSTAVEVSFDVIHNDLGDTENLIGNPYKEELLAKTGIEKTLQELEDLDSATSKIASVINNLMTDCATAKTAVYEFQEGIKNISRQLAVTKQLCESQDRYLCYTLQSIGLEIDIPLENITTDPNLKYLEKIHTEANFNQSAIGAREVIEAIPKNVETENQQFTIDMMNLLTRKRSETQKSIHALDVLASSVTKTMEKREIQTMDFIRKLVVWDLWRWLVVLGISTLLAIIWILFLCGAPCCNTITHRSISTLLAGVILSCFACLLLCFMGAIMLTIAGHGKQLLCSSMYDYPNFDVLGNLLDAEGVLYKKGILEEFGKEKDSLKIAEVLKHCQRNQTAYQTFHLYNKINISEVTNYNEWRDLKEIFNNFTTMETTKLKFFEPSLLLNLQSLTTVSLANFTSLQHRTASPITKRDLYSFVDQLHVVARQLSDAAIARKFDNIAFSVNEVIRKELQNLVRIKNSILLKITMLEVLLPPLSKQANQLSTHLKAIREFMDSEAGRVSEQNRRQFVARIESYLERLDNHVNETVTKRIGKCRPLWEIFHAVRFYLCKLVVDPMNGIAFSSFFLILLFLTIVPVVMKLIVHYKECNDDALTPISHRDGFGPDEEEAWTTPQSGMFRMELRRTSPDVDEGGIVSSSSSPPTPIRHAAARSIPPPPRLPTVSQRILSPRTSRVPSTSQLKSPKRKITSIASKFSKNKGFNSKPKGKFSRTGRTHESLRLVEPIAWKVGSTTPRSWI